MADPQEENELAKALRIIRDLPHPPKPMADAQHPDIAALVERLPLAADKLKAQGAGAEARDVEDAEAALRTLARPVEDEEVLRRIGWLEEMARHADDNDQPRKAAGLRDSASLLARLAREKARAEQEIARLREKLEEAQAALDAGFYHGARAIITRTLVAAAGAEEPR